MPACEIIVFRTKCHIRNWKGSTLKQHKLTNWWHFRWCWRGLVINYKKSFSSMCKIYKWWWKMKKTFSGAKAPNEQRPRWTKCPVFTCCLWSTAVASALREPSQLALLVQKQKTPTLPQLMAFFTERLVSKLLQRKQKVLDDITNMAEFIKQRRVHSKMF